MELITPPGSEGEDGDCTPSAGEPRRAWGGEALPQNLGRLGRGPGHPHQLGAVGSRHGTAAKVEMARRQPMCSSWASRGWESPGSGLGVWHLENPAP